MMHNRFAALCAILAALAAPAPATAAGTGYGSMLNGYHCADLRRPADERIAACRHMLVSHLLTSGFNAIMMIDLGVAYEDKGDTASALQSYSDSIAERPLWLAYYDRAVLYARQGRNAEALSDLDAAARLKPEESSIYLVRGQVHRGLGQGDLALADLDRAVQLKPDDAPSVALRCALRTGAKLPAGPEQGCVAAAPVTDADRAADVNKRAARAYRAGDYAAAIAGFTQALTIDSKSALALYLRGRAEHQVGNAAASDADIHAALVLDNDIDAKAAAFQP